MSFGQRTALPPRAVVAARPPIARRRGGYWLATASVAPASYAAVIAMALTPYFNPDGAPVAKVLAVAPGPVLNVVAIAAVVLLIVDLLSRLLKFSGPLIYGLLSGVVVCVLCLGLLSLTGARFDIAVVALFIPTAIGGCVLGLFRRRA